jgi:hypothetical protein
VLQSVRETSQETPIVRGFTREVGISLFDQYDRLRRPRSALSGAVFPAGEGAGNALHVIGVLEDDETVVERWTPPATAGIDTAPCAPHHGD